MFNCLTKTYFCQFAILLLFGNILEANDPIVETNSNIENMEANTLAEMDSMNASNFAETAYDYNNISINEESSAPCLVSSYMDDTVLRLSYRGKRGLGYHKGYATFGLFYIPSFACCDAQPIFDVRLHRIDDGRFASNVGVGYRKRFGEDIGGINVFYDYRDSQVDAYHQIGIGAEWFNPCFDIRVNGYFPIGPTTRHSSQNFVFIGGPVAERHIREHAIYLAELEAGKNYTFFSCWNIYAAVGPYYFKSRHHENAYGAKWRARTLLWDALTLEVAGTYDHIFKNRVQFYVGVDLPVKKLMCNFLDIFCKKICECVCEDKMRTPIYRNEMIVLRRSCFWRTNY